MAISTSTGSLGTPAISLLGPDPTHFAGHGGARTHVLNGNAFQQDSIVTSAGWQYVAFYSAGKTKTPSPLAASTTADNHVEPVFVHLARRKVLPQVGPWQTLIFDDYPQTTDDGHNTVQVRWGQAGLQLCQYVCGIVRRVLTFHIARHLPW